MSDEIRIGDLCLFIGYEKKGFSWPACECTVVAFDECPGCHETLYVTDMSSNISVALSCHRPLLIKLNDPYAMLEEQRQRNLTRPKVGA